MSMIRLLSAGRSLMGGRPPGKRLQMVDVRSLPKFEARMKTSNCKVQTSVKDQSSPFKAPGAVQDGGVAVALETAEKASNTKLQASPFVPQGGATEDKSDKHQAPIGKEKGAGFVKGLISKVKGLVARGQKAPKAVVPQPIQGELSLDNVKVMRNDLSDTDFVVVPKAVEKPLVQKSAVKAVEQANPAPAPTVESKKIWNRVTTLIGAGQG